ncbi:hypothetical protein Tco_0585921, partial [Tanacetum coccineum]
MVRVDVHMYTNNSCWDSRQFPPTSLPPPPSVRQRCSSAVEVGAFGAGMGLANARQLIQKLRDDKKCMKKVEPSSRSKAIEDIINIGSFVEALVLNHY